jgi:hypothetical protein
LEISPQRRDHRERETDQQRFLDVIAAVINQRRRQAGEQRGKEDGADAQPVGNQKRQRHDADAKDDRQRAQQ